MKNFTYNGIEYHYTKERNDKYMRYIQFNSDVYKNSDDRDCYNSITFYPQNMRVSPTVWNYIYRDGERSNMVETAIGLSSPGEPIFSYNNGARFSMVNFRNAVESFISQPIA